MRKRLATIALLLVFALMFTACQAAPASTTAASEPAASESTTAATTAVQGPPTELNIQYLITGSEPTDLALVETEINKILTPKLNVILHLMPINFGAAMQQQGLMLASGEKIDLMMTTPYSYQSVAAQGKVQDITDLVDQYGQGIKDVLGDFLKGSFLKGRLYGVTPYCDKAGGGGYVIRKDLLDKYSIDPTSIKSLEDLGKAFATIKEKEPKTYILGNSNQGSGFGEMYFSTRVDKLSDSFGVLMNAGQDLTVVNLFESQDYKDFVYLMRDWYTKGYIMKDVATNKDDQFTNMKSGKMSAYFTPTKPGIDVQEASKIGFEVYVPEVSKQTSNTSNVTLFQWVVPNACEAPDKAVQVLNEMYTNADLVNLMAWGIEGKHYVANADGTIGFPEGVNDTNSGYFINMSWMFGNSFLTKIWKGNSPDLYKKMDEFNKTAIISKAMGFTYDPEPVKNEVAAVTNVYLQYKVGLESGSVDPDKILPEFISKMKEAGIDKIVAEKQKQLDAWLAGK